MAKLSDILSISSLETQIESGAINRICHPDKPLAHLIYNKQCNLTDIYPWTHEMRLCRGLVYDTDTYEVVARPYAKFFAYHDGRYPETWPENLPHDIPTLTEKVDGSLGIVYVYNGELCVNSMRAFTSDVAVWAKHWFDTYHPELILPDGYTLCVEIMNKNNTVVIQHVEEKCVALGLIEIDTGKEMPRQDFEQWCGKNNLEAVKVYSTPIEVALGEDIKDREGYVATYPDGTKVKIKFDTYKALHRIAMGTNSNTVWEMMRDGKHEYLRKAYAVLTGDKRLWLIQTINQIGGKYSAIIQQAYTILEGMPDGLDKRQSAAYINQFPEYAALCFMIIKNQDYRELVYKRCRPQSLTGAF